MHLEIQDRRFMVYIMVTGVVFFSGEAQPFHDIFHLFFSGSIEKDVIIRKLTHAEFRVEILEDCPFERHIPDVRCLQLLLYFFPSICKKDSFPLRSRNNVSGTFVFDASTVQRKSDGSFKHVVFSKRINFIQIHLFNSGSIRY